MPPLTLHHYTALTLPANDAILSTARLIKEIGYEWDRND
jgi:hypothetical protein